MAIHLNKEYKLFVQTLETKPPRPTGFKVGDKVTFTNDQGVVFKGHRIIGFSNGRELAARFIHIDTDCYWFPKRADQLTLEG